MTGITVRPIRLHDLFRLRGVRAEAESLDQPLGRVSQRIADPKAALPVSCRAHKAFVALTDGSPAAVVDLRADPANHRWILTRVATSRHSTDVDDHRREMIWRELLIHSIRAAGAARAKRIHAAFSESSPVIPALLDTGFSMYARETVLMARRLPSGVGDGMTRQQESSDVWSIHQLYHSVTPRPVQYAEALTSNFWDGAVPGLVSARGYVIESGFEIAAHCRVTSVAGRHIMNAMVHPDARDLLKPLLSDVIDDIAPARADQIVICVPDYLQEYIAPLEELGFESIDRQCRTVKYTVVPRRIPAHSVEQRARELPERVAAGTPTFYLAGEQSPRDPDASRRTENRLDLEGLR